MKTARFYPKSFSICHSLGNHQCFSGRLHDGYCKGIAACPGCICHDPGSSPDHYLHSRKALHLNEVEIASVYYSNSGNLIVPIVTFILGQDWVLYGCVFMSVQLIFLWTHCKKIISRESSYDWKKIMLNINMISIFIRCCTFFRKNPFAGDHQ